MTEMGDSGAEGGLLRNLHGTAVARACCALVVLLLVAAIAYSGVMVVENYGHIAV